MRKSTRTAVLAAVLLMPFAAQSVSLAQAPGGAPGVTVQLVHTENIAERWGFTGRIRSPETVELIARVEGYLGPRQFADGSEVVKGQTLFIIEKDAYAAAVEQARANVQSAQAQVSLAQVEYDRARQLVERKTVAQSELDRALAELDGAKAGLAAAEAALRLSELDLSYTEIKAPITGRISAAAYSEGALVGPSFGALAEIVAQDPMRVAFPVPQAALIEVQRDGQKPEDVRIELRLADGSTYSEPGRIIYTDVRADSSTDTVEVIAEIDNPDGLLTDGQLVEVYVVQKEAQPRLVIPQAALLLDQQGPYVLTVDDTDTVQVTRFVPGPQRGALLEVIEGLPEGTRVITAGIQKVRPGMTVAPQLASAAPGDGVGSGGEPAPTEPTASGGD